MTARLNSNQPFSFCPTPSKGNHSVTMAKNKKHKEKTPASKSRKKRTERDVINTTPISSLCNVAGILESKISSNISDVILPSSMMSNELDDCLALMDQGIEVKDSTVSSEDGAKAFTNNATMAIEKEQEGEKNAPSSSRSDSLLSKNINVIKPNIPKIPHEEMMLPNIQVELSRHLQMGELSKFLLKQCPFLRMPTFERWVMDSKLEEKVKRKQILELNSTTGDFHKTHMDEVRHAKWKGRMKRKRQEMKSSLEMHLTSSGKRPMTEYDAVIPSMASWEDESSQRLLEEIEVGKKKDGGGKQMENYAAGVVRDLCQKACQSATNVENLSSHLGEKISVEHYLSTSKKRYSSKSNAIGRIHLETNKENGIVGTTISQEETGDSLDNHTYSLIYTRKNKSDKGKKMKKPFVVKINTKHYEKLQEMFHDNLQPSLRVRLPSGTAGWKTDKNNPLHHIFHHLVFCLLLRYSSLSGGQQLQDLRGGGMQGAIHCQVFDALENKSSNVMECFASPLNAYTRNFGSVFHRDLDHYFGSSVTFSLYH